MQNILKIQLYIIFNKIQDFLINYDFNYTL